MSRPSEAAVETVVLDEDDSSVTPVPDEEAARLREQVKGRCAETRVNVVEFDLENAFNEPRGGVKLDVPNGRDRREVYVPDAALADLLRSDFEHLSFLGDYEAVFNYETGAITAVVRPVRVVGSQMIAVRLRDRTRLEGGTFDEVDSDRWSLTLKATSGDELTFESMQRALPPIFIGSGAARHGHLLTLRPARKVERHDDALAILFATGESFLLALEGAVDASYNLVRRRADVVRRTARRAPNRATTLKYPTHSYDREPLSLYWFASGATGMPLAQYLAYYQCLEFYFPTYALNEARRRLKNALKAPGFSMESDASLGKLVQAARMTGSAGAEVSQLQATLKECVSEDDLREYMIDQRLFEAFSGKADSLRLPKVAAASADLLTVVAKRIYALRCQIVHTKDGGGPEDLPALLPSSREADQLGPDLYLVRFVARAVLIAASRPL